MDTYFSVEKTPEANPADYWKESLLDICGNFDTIVDDWDDFQGQISVRNVGGFDIAEIATNATEIIRSRRHISVGHDKYCFLILQQSGSAMLSQDGNDVFLEEGDMTFIDSSRPSTFKYNGMQKQISLHVPRNLLKKISPNSEVEQARIIPGGKGMGAVLSTFLHSIYYQAETIEEQDFGAIREMLLKLLTTTLRHDDVSDVIDIKHRQLKNIQNIIEQNLTNSEITPAFIADKAGVSTRHLHRLFKLNDVSFSEWVKKRRLAEARRQLANKQFSDQSIIQIAFYWGFNDAAHFSRVFKAEFGISPRQYRVSQNVMTLQN